MGNAFAKKKKVQRPKVAGSIRQSQLISTFGIGSIVDFVSDTVIIAGVDDWDVSDKNSKIYNENLSSLTGAKYFFSPKTEELGQFWEKSEDIPSYVFPEKLYCPHCKSIIDIKEVQSQKSPYKCFLPYNDRICNSLLVASRFVVICENGHMEDFPYSWWVHKSEECSSGKQNPRIKMYNVDNRTNIDSLILECANCGKKRPMSGAFQGFALSGKNAYFCSNQNPHIKDKKINNQIPCNSIMKTRLRSSSSIYFPVVQSALSIPPWSKYAVQLIQKEYTRLKYIPEDGVKKYLYENLFSQVTKPLTIDDLFNAYILVKQHRDLDIIRNEEDIYKDEYSILCRGTVESDEEYSATEVERPELFKNYFDKIVSIDKLTVVQTICGFTRGKPWSGTDLKDSSIVPLASSEKDWLPAVKLNGEGIFVKFNSDKIAEWKKVIGKRYNNMKQSLENSYFQNKRFSAEYVLLHTFSHLLIRELSDVCGYNAASLKEKIYSFFDDSNHDMCGILIYLASSDCDGSLGGLISIVKNTEVLEKIFCSMIKKGLWCSADPLCYNSMQQGHDSLNYAACHDCTLLPETSCEFRNLLLDRVSVVGIQENRKLGFLGDLAQTL